LEFSGDLAVRNNIFLAFTSGEDTEPREVEMHAYPGPKAHFQMQLESTLPVIPDAGTFGKFHG
jgi:hypothetical protein